MVIRRSNALDGNWEAVYREVAEFRRAAGNSKLKVILATGELCDPAIVYRASMAAIQAGADFIKTSTGKESVNATLDSSAAMLSAIRDWRDSYGRLVGFKAAGGIRTTAQAVQYLRLAKAIMGDSFTEPATFRLGASTLLEDILQNLASVALDS